MHEQPPSSDERDQESTPGTPDEPTASEPPAGAPPSETAAPSDARPRPPGFVELERSLQEALARLEQEASEALRTATAAGERQARDAGDLAARWSEPSPDSEQPAAQQAEVWDEVSLQYPLRHDLVALLRETQAQAVAKAEAAATWQTRAEMLAGELHSARAEIAGLRERLRALGVPTGEPAPDTSATPADPITYVSAPPQASPSADADQASRIRFSADPGSAAGTEVVADARLAAEDDETSGPLAEVEGESAEDALRARESHIASLQGLLQLQTEQLAAARAAGDSANAAHHRAQQEAEEQRQRAEAFARELARPWWKRFRRSSSVR